jgi:hypothetical protein
MHQRASLALNRPFTGATTPDLPIPDTKKDKIDLQKAPQHSPLKEGAYATFKYENPAAENRARFKTATAARADTLAEIMRHLSARTSAPLEPNHNQDPNSNSTACLLPFPPLSVFPGRKAKRRDVRVHERRF